MPIDLAAELTQVEAEISEAAAQDAALAGGLLKALIASEKRNSRSAGHSINH
jgi:hypothetical protein